ncbi:MAG: PA domain-containing protein [Candidatus Eisenbacteria bacterium]
MRLRSLLPAMLTAIGILAADPAISFSATITIVNMDGAGEGFNDGTAAAPVGGNAGTTIGQQRLNVFQEAANIWGAILPSAVTIPVGARFDPLSCTATSAVLGSAGAINISRDFAGAEFPGTWYHQALANRLNGTDLVPGSNDITATFNANLGQPGCLTGAFFYYGFDHNEGGNIDLLAVVLHELGHGLGFSAFTNGSTGVMPAGFPGIYDRHLLDLSNGLRWNAMTDGQRAASAINTGNLVWDGTAVRVKAPSFLDPKPEVVVLTPAAVAGTYTSGSAAFGAALTVAGVTDDVVLAVDATGAANDACSPLTNGAAVSGKIAMVDRGTCPFTVKAANVQNAGGVGMIMVNNIAGLAPEIGGSDPSIAIPVTSLSQTEGNAIKAQLGSGVTATLRVSNTRLAGADNSNRPFMFAPNPLQSGSSVSHWDVSTSPNLLMEPAINPDLTDVDLTTFLFEDIGWLPRTTSVPAVVPVTGLLRLGLSSPNPFATQTRLTFTLSRPMSVSVDVLDTGGRLVRKLMSETLAVGERGATWDGTDGDGRRVPPGIYLYRLRAGGEIQTRRVALVR